MQRDWGAVEVSERLADELADDARRWTFWLNVHNAHIQLLFRRNPRAFHRRRCFARTQVHIAGEWLSLDDVVHGVVRPSRWKCDFGYLGRPNDLRRRSSCA